jgi:dihydrofolate reductase
MRTLIVSEFVSVDGVMEAPGGEPGYKHTGWVIPYSGPEQLQYKLDEVLAAEALLLGRVTYESFAEAWPPRKDPEGFADKMNAMPKHVVSATLSELAWNNSTLLEGAVPDSFRALKETDGGDILVAGSRTLVHALLEHGLVDELRLMIFPVILGSGGRVFPDGLEEKTELTFADTRVFPSGVAVLTYRPTA